MNLSLGEQMVRCQSRLCPIQFDNMKKPISMGVRIDSINDATNGVCVAFLVDDRTLSTADKITALVSQLPSKGHHITFDNFYTTPKNMSAIRLLGHEAYGTWRSNFGVPACLQDVTLTKHSWRSTHIPGYEHMMAYAWFDSKKVFFLSTVHADQESTVDRRRSGGAVPAPTVARDYDKYMGGVDCQDQRRATLTCTRYTRLLSATAAAAAVGVY
jgi:hypothetical protein